MSHSDIWTQVNVGVSRSVYDDALLSRSSITRSRKSAGLTLEGDDELLVVEPIGIRGVEPDRRVLPPDADVLVHHDLPLRVGQQVPAPRLDERVHEQVAGVARPDHEAGRLTGSPRFGELVDGAPGHREVAVGDREIRTQVRAVERGLQR